LASGSGWRIGKTNTLVPSRTRFVTAAAQVRLSTGSKNNGERGKLARGTMMCSLTQTSSRPNSSARIAARRIFSGVACSPA
jgi:hypothetical protein